MCLIIDASVAHQFAPPLSDAAVVVVNWLTDRKGKIVYGGQLASELTRTPFRRLLVQFARAGIAIQVPEASVAAEQKRVVATGLCRSNDPHIIALARVSHARVLFSDDTDLHSDFKNARLINDPRGTIYQSARHVHLLKHTSKCVRSA